MPSYLSYKRQIAVLDDNSDDITWITVKGNHIPIKKGEKKGDAIKKFFESKKSGGAKSETGESAGHKRLGELNKKYGTQKGYLVQSEEPLKSKKQRILEINKKGQVSLTESGSGFHERVEQKKDPDFASAKNVVKTDISKEYRGAVEKILDNAKKSADNQDITVERVIDDAVALKKFTAEDIKTRIDNYEKYRKDVKEKNDGVLVDTAMKHTVGGRWETNSKGKKEYVWDSWKPERLKVWDEILNKETVDGKLVDIDWEAKKPAEGERPRIILLGGRGGSGKSKFTDPDKPLGDDSFDKSKFLVIDPDEYKTQLPEYKSLVDGGSEFGGLNAWEVHEESSAMKKLQLDRALERGVNVILDGTMAQYGSVKKTLDKFKASNYIVDVAFMELPREQSAVRGVSRAMRVNSKTGVPSGRYVPTDLMLGMTNCEENFVNLIPDADNWVLYENTGKEATFVARGGKNVK